MGELLSRHPVKTSPSLGCQTVKGACGDRARVSKALSTNAAFAFGRSIWNTFKKKGSKLLEN
jgi:hypothetical protein